MPKRRNSKRRSTCSSRKNESRYLAIPFFDFWLEHRLPSENASDQSLRPIGYAINKWNRTLAKRLTEYTQTGAIGDESPPPAPSKVAATKNDHGEVIIEWQAVAVLKAVLGALSSNRTASRLPRCQKSRSVDLVGHRFRQCHATILRSGRCRK